VEPPKFITARHIGEVFSKIGFKPETGKHIFTVLCCVLKRRRDIMEASTVSEKSEKLGAAGAGNKEAPYKRRHNPLEDSFDGSNLSEELSRALLPNPSPIDASKRILKTSPNIADANLMLRLPTNASMSSNGSSNDMEQLGYPDDPDIQAAAVAMASSGTSKMDIHDFMEACQMDDVLVQAVLRKPRQRFLELLDKLQVARTDSPQPYGSERTTELDAAMGRGIDTSALEQELIAALTLVEKESKSSFPLATAVKRATLHAAFELAASVTVGAQNLINGLSETMLESSDDPR